MASSAVIGIRRNVRSSFSCSVLQCLCKRNSDTGLYGRVLPSSGASSSGDPLLYTPLSQKFPPAVAKFDTFGADRPGYDSNASPARKHEASRVYQTATAASGRACLRFSTAILKPQLTRSTLKEDESLVGNCLGASKHVAQESCHGSPRQRVVYAKELPIGSAYGPSNRNRPSTSTTSEAIAILKHRQQQGQDIDPFTFVDILKRCSKEKDLTAARHVHDCIIQSGMENHHYVSSSLLTAYIKCGRLQVARRVFDGLDKTNRHVITWNMLIGAYAKSGRGMEAYRLFLQMKREGVTPNAVTYLSILNASASEGALEWVKEVHAHARRAGLEIDLGVCGALIHMYAKSGSIGEARVVFDRLQKRDVIIWNAMIGAYAESGCGEEAYRLFLQMKREGFIPDAITTLSILNASASEGALEWVKEVHGDAIRAGLESDLRVGSALVHMYAKSGSITEARLVFDRIAKRNVITWTAMIGAYAESGCGGEAYRLFLQMKREGVIPNAVTYVSILNPSSSAGALEWVKEVHSDAIQSGLELDLGVGTALVQMYAKSGSIDDARRIFERMQKRDIVTWTTIIGGYAQHGYGHQALKLFKKMHADGVKPDGTTFVAVLSACCHAGLLQDGITLFSAMTQDYGIQPTNVHYTCMVDLLGRAGRLEEAKSFIRDMPFEPEQITWQALLGACRTYGNVELGEVAANELLKLQPHNASAYVLLSNIYAAAGKWEKVSMVRSIMQERGIRKEPGRSWIEIDNQIHEFVVGDTSHPETKAIYNVLKSLTEKMKIEGYIPDTQLVLQDICEEDKELALCSHSEKLAIAYGILCIPLEKPIRVFKNLRVCSDCHTATKFISKVTGREIIARDANRFHHFKHGVCSCNDYW